MADHTTQVREVMEVYPRRRIVCRYAACSCGWRGEERMDAALASEDAARHRRFAPRRTMTMNRMAGHSPFGGP